MKARVARIGLAIVASAMVLTVLIPAELWRGPMYDATHTEFDPVLMASDEEGQGVARGSIEFAPESLLLSALPGSNPNVHLLTTPLSYEAVFNVRVIEAESGAVPLIVSMWAPFENAKWQVEFSDTPEKEIKLRRVERGVVTQSEVIGTYEIGVSYSVSIVVDRDLGAASLVLRSDDDAVEGYGLAVKSYGVNFDSHLITDQTFPVAEGETYTMTSSVQQLRSGPVGMSIEWIDADGNRIDISESWLNRQANPEWFDLVVTDTAPADAASARLEIATSSGSAATFTGVAFSRSGGNNVVPAGSMAPESALWRPATRGGQLDRRLFSAVDAQRVITRDDWPQLFEPTRLALTVESVSEGGSASVQAFDLRMSLPHQRWLAVTVEDARLRIAAVTLAVAALLLFMLRTSDGPPLRQRVRRIRRERRVLWLTPRQRVLTAIASAVTVFANAWLSRVGSLNADVVGARVWGYVAGRYGLWSLYHLPNIASAEAEQWSGFPLQEAGYPYGPVMGYITGAQGLLYRLFVDGASGVPNANLVDFLAKATNLLFIFVCGVLIYSIVSKATTRRAGWIAGMVFLVNPAVWFASSVWGSSQVVSMAFLLFAVLAVQEDWGSLAWFACIAAAMTRPQYLPIVAILAISLLLRRGSRRTVDALPAGIAMAYVFLLPWTTKVSPTLPVDNLVNVYLLHVGDANDLWTLPLSWGGMSIWILVGSAALGLTGIDRVLSSSEALIAGPVNAHLAGTLLAICSVLGIAVAYFVRARRADMRPIVIVLAAASMAFLTFNTATPTYHFILPLGLLIASRASLPRWAYVGSVAGLSLTSFISMYAMGAYWLTQHPTWSLGLYSPGNPLATFVAAIPQEDWVLSGLALMNLLIVVLIGVYSVLALPRRTFRIELSHAAVAGIDAPADLDRGSGAPGVGS